MPTTCCNTSVGVIITDIAGRLLLIERADGRGVAPVAGHALDTHPSWADAARTEVAEEVGLTVTSLTDTGVGGWRPNQCGRDLPGLRGVGHEWRIYRADVSGALTPDPRETRGAAWYTLGQVQTLADATIQAAAGKHEDSRQLEPVWVEWLSDLGLITISREGVALADRATRPDPMRVWQFDFAAEDLARPQTLYFDTTQVRRTTLARLLAESDDTAVIGLPVATTVTGPRVRSVLRVGRISNLRPASPTRS